LFGFRRRGAAVVGAEEVVARVVSAAAGGVLASVLTVGHREQYLLRRVPA
jgi:hypothetical protein